MHVSLFGTVLSISDNIMHYQWLISVFLKNTSRDQLLQKAYYVGLQDDEITEPVHTLFFLKNKLNKNIEAEIARKIRTI